MEKPVRSAASALAAVSAVVLAGTASGAGFALYEGSARGNVTPAGLTAKGANNNMAGINVPYSVMYVSMPVTGVLNLFAVIGEWLERGEKA